MERKYDLLEDDTLTLADGTILHRIKALRDFGNVEKGDLGGYIEKEENLSHRGDCWVSGYAKVHGNATVYWNADVYGSADIYDNACITGTAQVHGNATVYCDARVAGNARIYDNAQIYDNAMVFDNAQVFENAHVHGNTKVYGNAYIYDNACITGTAQVHGNATVCCDAHVAGNARIHDSAEICNYAYITSNDDYIYISPIGSRNEFTTFYTTKNRDIVVKCGCFNNTIERFIEAVNKTHKGRYRSEYLNIVDYVKYVLRGNYDECSSNTIDVDTSSSDTTFNEKLDNALKIIRDACQREKNCKDCVLRTQDGKCAIESRPDGWILVSDDNTENRLFR